MSVNKKRININISKELERVLQKLAKRDSVSQFKKIECLLELAIEIEEDEFFDTNAFNRDNHSAIFISHEHAWAKI